MARISWHPAFVQAIQHELIEYRDILSFESEHQLLTEPLRIDVLIIKKKKNVIIKKNIARIFQQFNIIEYKSPEDRATIEAYHKTQSYARLYAALNKVDINDISVTVVATRRPQKLLTFLNKQYTLTHIPPAIYLVTGDTCPTQIIVSEKLSEDDNLWLGSLRNNLTIENLERFAMPAESGQSDLPADAYFQVIGAANVKAMEELYMQKKKGIILSEKLDAFFYEQFGASFEAKGITKGITKGIAIGVAEGEARGEARGIAIGVARGEARGIARGAVRGKAEAVLAVLRARFKKVPKGIEKEIFAISDPIALESWAAQAATCETLNEFAEALK